ncbi:MAG TPA: hypothetical protein DDW76_01920 [Cyanobacteria bacterium UBA11369]|nr:hypothetical protein [Cyanobacteria bacterium UBA11371]HBE31608.1 hypothetical protein [Cyanobacteria bacterium UBA11368]HBE47587.1 hypothetical protein [Cyanobacteria bacterium UBA11369]
MIAVEDQDKVRFAKFGANKLFEVEYDTRQNMSDQQLIELFDRLWLTKIERLVLNGEVCEAEEVDRRLLDKFHSFIDPQQEHRSFHYRKAEFIAQLLRQDNSQYKLTQLWRVASSDEHPKTLFINFSSVEERERFASLAKSLRINDEQLGLQLLRNFMNLHPGYEAFKEDPP